MQRLAAHRQSRYPCGGSDHHCLLCLVDKALQQGGLACSCRARHEDVIEALVNQRENLVRLDGSYPLTRSAVTRVPALCFLH